MNDFDWDVLQKKRIARSASKKKGNRKGCRLPCDGLTQKQIEKKHGEVFCMNIDKPMSYEDWKKLPDDMKAEYYDAMVARFHVGTNSIAEMFGCQKTALQNYILSHKMKVMKIKGRAPQKTIEHFREWWQDARRTQADEIPHAVPETEPEIEKAPEKTMETPAVTETVKIPVSRYELHFNHVMNWEELTPFLAGMPLPEDACIIINVRKAWKEDVE